MDLIEHLGGTTWPLVSPSPASQNSYTWAATVALAAGSKLFFNEAFA
jgi:hypothetical protein